MTTLVECVRFDDVELSDKEYSLPAEGTATFEIVKVESGQSQAKNLKTTVHYKVIDSKGNPGYVFEDVPMHVAFRVARIASITETKRGEDGKIDIDLWLNKKGRGVIKHDNSPGYSVKAVWSKFLKGEVRELRSTSVVEPTLNDDIPW